MKFLNASFIKFLCCQQSGIIVLGRRLEWKNFEVTVTDRKSIVVRDVTNDVKESLGNALILSVFYLCCTVFVY